MILSLHIKNIALIRELELGLSEGLNILSGETGAGKSIIIDSLNFVLGDRADKSLIRHGEKSAAVSVVFSACYEGELWELFDEAGIEKDDIIIVNRVMTENRSECRVNGTPVNLSLLKKIVTRLVDIHSQHEHQALLVESNHIKILDNYRKALSGLKEEFNVSLENYKRAEAEILSFPPGAERERRADILKYQLDEIKKAAFKDGEEEKLIEDRAKFYNFQKISFALSSAYAKLNGEDSVSALSSVHSAIKDVLSVSQYIMELEPLAERLESAKIEIRDIADTLKDELESSDFDAARMETVEKRIEEIRKIKKRYGQTEAEIEKFYADTEREYKKIINAEERIEELNGIIEKEKSKLIKLAKALNNERNAAAKDFEKAILLNLSDLGMANSTFKAEITFPESDEEILDAVRPGGADTVRFLISPNKGEPLKPLTKIASGGEMSRFMLGLKNITADLEGIDTLVFDEIDTGISGRIAKVVACKLYDIARTRQVIAVTHLPQLASMADTHYLITKEEVERQTLTFVNRLDAGASIKEIMRLAGSAENSEAGCKSAMELKDWANSYKNAE